MRFEWDKRKARSNLVKHRIEFEQAVAVFKDTNALIELDDDPYEERWRATGKMDNRLVRVIYVERGIETIRIISARRVNTDEQIRYLRQALPQG